jgi:hypothetical protein
MMLHQKNDQKKLQLLMQNWGGKNWRGGFGEENRGQKNTFAMLLDESSSSFIRSL